MSEEYNDNVFLTRTGRQADFVTGAAPVLKLGYRAPLWDWDLDYRYDYRFYANNSVTDDETSTAKLASVTRIIKDVLFLNVTDDYARVSLDTARNFTQESTFVNQSDQNILDAGPSFVARFSDRAAGQLAYHYRNTWYKQASGVDTRQHIAAADLTQDLTSRTTVTSGVRHERNDNAFISYSREEVFIKPSFAYGEGSTIRAVAGYSWFDFDHLRRFDRFNGEVVAAHRHGGLKIGVEAGVSYIPDPLRVVTREDRAVLSISRETERTTVRIAARANQYWNAASSQLESKVYGADGSMERKLSERSRFAVSVTVDRLHDTLYHTFTNRLLTQAIYERKVREDLSWSIEYRYSDVSTPGGPSNYDSNRLMAGLTKNF